MADGAVQAAGTSPRRGAPRGGLGRRAWFQPSLHLRAWSADGLWCQRLGCHMNRGSTQLSLVLWGSPRANMGWGHPLTGHALSPSVHGGSGRRRPALAQRVGSMQGLHAKVRASWRRPAAHRWTLSDHVLALTWGPHSAGCCGVTAWCPEGPRLRAQEFPGVARSPPVVAFRGLCHAPGTALPGRLKWVFSSWIECPPLQGAGPPCSGAPGPPHGAPHAVRC